MISPTNTTNIAEPKVLLRVVNRVAIITLNRPTALNSLSSEMIQELTRVVEWCRTNDNIVALVLRGAGEKGFCAGGDVRELYHSVSRGDSDWRRFFADEYRLDYSLHVFPKPVVALMDGIVMGGGMGLAQGADLCVPSSWLGTFEERLGRMSTKGDLLESLCLVFEPPGNVIPHALLSSSSHFVLRHFGRHSSIKRTVATLHSDLQCDPPRETRQWLQATLDTTRSHSPTMLCVAREALIRGRQMTLAQCLRMELSIGQRAVEDGDFREGVRALLIDKDNCPRWTPATLPEVTPERVGHFLSSPWRCNAHPLVDLEAEFATN
jgi:enoyl-CoA hydratase/carnithine racemase